MSLPAQVENDLKELEAYEASLQNPEPPETETEPEPEIEETKAEETPDPQPEPEVKKEDFEQKYNTLRGKYDAEVPRLHAQVKELMEKVDQLSTAAAAPKPEAPPEPKQYVTDADKENFGEDLLDVQRRVAMEVAEKYQGQISKLEGTIAALTKRLDETGGQMGQMSFEQRLHMRVPDFDQINNSPEWVAWLNEVDPLVRGPRRVMAQKAFEAGDADAVADYVKLFKDSLKPAQPKQSDRKAELESQVAPTRSSTPTRSAESQAGRIYSESQVNQLWDKVRTLSVSGQIDEAAQLEAELSAAYVEGRVRPG